MSDLVYLPSADQDLLDILDFIARDDPAAAERFVDRVRKAVERLRTFPLSAQARPELGPDLRSLPVDRYTIFHRVEEDRVSIVRVLHSARDLDTIFGVG